MPYCVRNAAEGIAGGNHIFMCTPSSPASFDPAHPAGFPSSGWVGRHLSVHRLPGSNDRIWLILTDALAMGQVLWNKGRQTATANVTIVTPQHDAMGRGRLPYARADSLTIICCTPDIILISFTSGSLA